ncbi:hypothetical protein BGZ63DRAFT_452304 [Mariannaea sp. PMI_226]|nr:hypothetical protein BGZ63DRAFT_452304 [Mariannaea sp. PMI_226]
MVSVVIIGASRGIGYALLDVWSRDAANTVVGLVRDKKTTQNKVTADFHERSNIHLVTADLTDFESLRSAHAETGAILGQKADILIANAAVADRSFDDIGNMILNDIAQFDADMLNTFKTNVLGISHFLALFTPLLQNGEGKKAVVISSGAGDPAWVAENELAGGAPYAISKAAVNMVVAKFQAQLKKDGIVVTAISPGLVDTEFVTVTEDPAYSRYVSQMGAIASKAEGFNGLLQPLQSALLIQTVIGNLTLENHAGEMVSHHGNKAWL